MFLANLTDKQKNSFLSLAQALISVDGILSEDETSMMEQYRKEMEFPVSSQASTQSAAQAIEAFKCASAPVKKQIIFELVALACADNAYADAEKHFLEEIAATLRMDADFLGKCKTYVLELTDLYGRIGKFVGE